jgi:hypothetical protein
MKFRRIWLPKAGKHPGKYGITECTEPLTLDRLTARLVIGSVVFIGVTSAVLGIWWNSPKNAVPLKVEATQLSARNAQQDAVDVKSKSVMLDPPMRGTLGYPSSLPTPELAIKAPPESPYLPPPVRKPAVRRSGTESEARGWRFPRRLSAVAQNPGHVRDGKRKWPKAFIEYLDAHQDFLKKTLRPGK